MGVLYGVRPEHRDLQTWNIDWFSCLSPQPPSTSRRSVCLIYLSISPTLRFLVSLLKHQFRSQTLSIHPPFPNLLFVIRITDSVAVYL